MTKGSPSGTGTAPLAAGAAPGAEVPARNTSSFLQAPRGFSSPGSNPASRAAGQPVPRTPGNRSSLPQGTQAGPGASLSGFPGFNGLVLALPQGTNSEPEPPAQLSVIAGSLSALTD